MDTTTEKNCMEEISSLILDALQKVTLKTISNNWLVTNDIAEEVLKKWTQQNEKKVKDLVKEFLVQGINSKGKFTIAVVNEETKKKIDEKWKDIKRSWLYSVETKSNSRDLDLPPKYEEIKVKNILIDVGQRDLQVPVAVKQEPMDTTKIKTPFGMVKPVVKKTEESNTVQKQKTEELSLKSKEMPKKSLEKSSDTKKPVEDKKPEEKHVEEKKKSPPTAPKPSTSKNAKKNTKPVQKGNITSFFNKPSSTTTSTKSVNGVKQEKKEPSPEAQEEKMEVDEVQEEKMEVDQIPRKRSASPPPKSKKKPPQKKQKESKTKKRSRIQVMDDSSEDEDEEKSIFEEPESKLIKFDREVTPEPKAAHSRSPTPEEKPQIEKPVGKHKAKRWVTKRFETDDGFIRTEKVLEEYSASEDEAVNDENRKKNSPPAAKEVPVKSSPVKKATSAKAKSNVTAKTKQGSIMNFFTKK